MVEMDNYWITLSEYVLLVLVCAFSALISAFALFLLHRLKRTRNFDATPSLLVYLASLGICCAFLAGQYTLLTLYLLAPDLFSFSSLSPTQLIFWSGLIPGSLIPASPICVLFLSLDRLLIILRPSLYTIRPRIKQSLALFSTVAVIGLFAMSLVVNVAQKPTTEKPECISFGCLTSDASRLIYAVNRLAVALPNFLAGTAFLLALFAFRRRLDKSNVVSSVAAPSTVTKQMPASRNSQSRSQKMSDRLTFYVVLFEFLLDLLPNFGNLLLTTMFNINISVYVGAFRSMSYAACALCSVLAHTMILWRIFASKTSMGNATVAPAAMTRRMTQPSARNAISAKELPPIAGGSIAGRNISGRIEPETW